MCCAHSHTHALAQTHYWHTKYTNARRAKCQRVAAIVNAAACYTRVRKRHKPTPSSSAYSRRPVCLRRMYKIFSRLCRTRTHNLVNMFYQGFSQLRRHSFLYVFTKRRRGEHWSVAAMLMYANNEAPNERGMPTLPTTVTKPRATTTAYTQSTYTKITTPQIFSECACDDNKALMRRHLNGEKYSVHTTCHIRRTDWDWTFNYKSMKYHCSHMIIKLIVQLNLNTISGHI